MIATYVLRDFSLAGTPGIGRLYRGGLGSMRKLLLVVALTAIPLCAEADGKAPISPRTATRRPARFYRIINEVADSTPHFHRAGWSWLKPFLKGPIVDGGARRKAGMNWIWPQKRS